MDTYVPLHGNFELRPLGVAMGNIVSVKHTYIKTPLVGRRQPMTSLPARPQYKGRRENTAFSSSSSLTGLFEACILVRVQFSIIMASTSKAFKKCVDPCPRYLTPDDTNAIFAFLFGQGARTRCPWGEICVHCEFVSMKKLPSRLSLFSRKERQPSASHDSGPTATEANEIVGFAVGYGRWVREGPPPFRTRRPRTRVSCWNVTMRSFWHHQIQRLVLCWVMPSKSRRCLREKKLRLNPLNPPALHMTSYWRLWSIKINLSGHKPPARASLPFFLNLHVGLRRSGKSNFSRIHSSSILVMLTLGDVWKWLWGDAPCARVDSQLPVGETSSLKAPSESGLNGRAYAAAGQTVASLHTMDGASGVPDWSAERPG